ncbi:MAG: ABC transporter ATP-binding protein [bacterium]|nr:ABC transporter ATP-binding protein [bacterium]
MDDPLAQPTSSQNSDPHSGQATAERYREFARLGQGGQADQLSFKLVVGLLRRGFPLLVPVKKPIIWLIVGWTLLLGLGFWPGILVVQAFSNGVLNAAPLSEAQALLLFLPPEPFVGVEHLSAELRTELVSQMVLVVTGFLFFALVCFLGLEYLLIYILQTINQNLRVDMFDRLQSLSLRFHSEQRVGDSIYRMFQDSAMVTRLIELAFLSPLRHLAVFLYSLGIVCIWDPWMALVLAFGWPAVLVVSYLLSRALRGGFRAARETNSGLTAQIQEVLEGIKVIKAYSAEAREQARFEEASWTAFDAARVGRNRFVVYKLLVFQMVGLLAIAATGWGVWLTMNGEDLFASDLVVALGFAAVNSGRWDLGFLTNFRMRFDDGTTSIKETMNLWGKLQDVAIGLDRAFEVLDLEPEVEDAEGAAEMPPLREGIVYRDLSFRYEPDRPVLRGVSLEVPAGCITAVIGPTGSGKSTLVSMLLRLYDPDEGCIEVDGRDIREFTTESLRSQVAIALQENALFGTSVRENIRYAVPGATDQQVTEAARVAGAHEFIEALEHGYDTELGERGIKLSSGQRQRISIARAVLKDTPILILDEPTASLDAVTELKVLGNLGRWGEGRVILLITHRLSTIRLADQVAVIQAGQLVELGRHAELMQLPGGKYRSLVETEADLLTEAAARA